MPLKGIKVIEIAGLAPGPMCGKFLRDFGATVLLVDKVSMQPFDFACVDDGKKSIALNLKSEDGVRIFRKLSLTADVLIEPFRKGVMEKLGLGPKVLLADNPKLIYARLTGYGQHGQYSAMAGHDINYLSITGLLSMYGWRGRQPIPPCNFSEFTGGSLLCFTGILLALLDRQRTGVGQVLDSNITEGISYIGSWLMRSKPILFNEPRGNNWLDGGAHFYDTYATKDGKFMAVGALEPQFYEELLRKLDTTPDVVPQHDYENGRKFLENKFKEKTQSEWCEIFDLSDACVTPVLSIPEATQHRHNQDRQSFHVSSDGVITPARAPKLSNHPNDKTEALPQPIKGANTIEILSELGYNRDEIERFLSSGVVKYSPSSKI